MLEQQFRTDAGEWTIYSNEPEPIPSVTLVQIRSLEWELLHSICELSFSPATIKFTEFDGTTWLDCRHESCKATWLALSYFLRWHA